MDLKAIAEEEARRAGVPLEFFMRLITQESNWNPKAKSHVGAYGLTQVMPDTWRQPGYGVTPGGNIDDPREQIRFGADYAAAMLNAYDGDQRKAAGAYNAGPGTMNKWDGDPASLPKETRDYMNIVGGGKQGAGVGGYGVGAAVDGTKLGFGNAVEGSTMDGYEDRQPYRYKGALTDFAGDMLDASKETGAGLGALNDSSNAITDYQHKLIDPEYRLAAGRDTTISGSLPSKVTGGAGGSVQGAAGTDTLMPNGRPMMPNMSKVPLSKGVPVGGGSPAVQGGGGAPAPTAAPQEAGGGFMSKIFGEAGSDKRQGSADILAALSQGLGQMSHGQPVDLSNVFQRIQRRQEFASAQEAQAARDAQSASQFEQTLAIQQQNANTAAGKLARDIAKDNGQLTPEVIAAYDNLAARYPEMADTVTLAKGGNKDAQRTLANYDSAKSIEATAAQLTPAGRQALQDFMGAKTPEERAKVLSDPALSDTERETILKTGSDILGLEPKETAAITTGRELYEQSLDEAGKSDLYPGGVGEAIEVAAKIAGGQPGGRRTIQQINNDLGQGNKYFDEARTSSRQASVSLGALDVAEAALAGTEGKETSALIAGPLTSIGKVIGTFAGSDAMYAAMEAVGIDVDAEQELSQAQTSLMRAISASYAGQGTISDGERAQMMKEVLNPSQTTRGMQTIVARLKADNTIKRKNAQTYMSGLDRSDANVNWADLLNDQEAMAKGEAEIVDAARRKAENDWATAAQKNYPDGGYSPLSPEQALIDTTPRITEKVAKFHIDALPQITVRPKDGGEAFPVRVYLDDDTGQITYLKD